MRCDEKRSAPVTRCITNPTGQRGYRHVDQVMEHGEYATRGAFWISSRWGVSCLIVLISLMMNRQPAGV